MDLTEGGIRVPYIVHWPKGIAQPGRVSTQHCMTMDWTATILDIAGAQPPADHKLDGVSMVPTLQQADITFARPMFWRMKYNDQRAYRMGPWKYLKINAYEYLFNIENDARERANRAKREPERLSTMRITYEAWAAQVPPVPEEARVSLVYTLADMPAR
jgi:arylsulfatase A-like enzyme